MKEKVTELIFIVEKSGSMSGLEEDTIGGFNSMLRKQKQIPGQAFVSTYFFNYKLEKIHFRESINSVEEITIEDYQAGGCTALIDAIGTAIEENASIQKNKRKRIQDHVPYHNRWPVKCQQKILFFQGLAAR